MEVARWLTAQIEAGSQSDHTLQRVLSRLIGYAVGNQSAAEGFIQPADEPLPDWITSNAEHPEILEFARQVAVTSSSRANTAVSGLQAKASALVNTLMVAAPGSFYIIAITLSQLDGSQGLAAFVLLAIGSLALTIGLLLAALATGLLRSVEVVISKFVTPAAPLAIGTAAQQLQELRLREIRAWHNSAALAMRTTWRLGQDLYAARRFAIGGSLLFALGLFLAWSAT